MPLCVAFSGGPDSSALLHALAGMPAARARGLRALHVDHGLHPDSARWAEHGTRVLRRARRAAARCCAFRWTPPAATASKRPRATHATPHWPARCEPGEWLLLGHHRDDQVETVLLKLLRGAGPEGLGGMRERRPLGAGQLWRPLLGAAARRRCRPTSQAHQLPCIDDPANADIRLSRNVLRHEILPRLRQHWPQAADSIEHSAALCRAAADALRTQWLAALDAAARRRPPISLDASGWLALAPALREPVARSLAAWPRPARADHAHSADRSSARSRRAPGRVPCIRWPGAELHVWKGRLWALPPRAPMSTRLAIDLGRQRRCRCPTAAGSSLRSSHVLAPPLTVRLRRGGEHIKPAGDRHTRELRDLFQQADDAAVATRGLSDARVEGDDLVAVADRWISARGVALLHGARICWTPGAEDLAGATAIRAQPYESACRTRVSD